MQSIQSIQSRQSRQVYQLLHKTSGGSSIFAQ